MDATNKFVIPKCIHPAIQGTVFWPFFWNSSFLKRYQINTKTRRFFQRADKNPDKNKNIWFL